MCFTPAASQPAQRVDRELFCFDILQRCPEIINLHLVFMLLNTDLYVILM